MTAADSHAVWYGNIGCLCEQEVDNIQLYIHCYRPASSKCVLMNIRELKQATFLTTRTSWSKKAELRLVKNMKFISG